MFPKKVMVRTYRSGRRLEVANARVMGPPLAERDRHDRRGELVMTDEEKQSILYGARATIDRLRAADGARDKEPPRERVETPIKYRRTEPESPAPAERARNLTDAGRKSVGG